MSRLQVGLFSLAGLLFVAGGMLVTRPERPAASLSPGPLARAGEPAGDFEVTLLDGSRFSLSRHLATDGRPVFLNFWASWCIPCREEMPTLDEAAREHPGILFLGVAVEDDPQAARAFAEEIDVSYPLAIDETGTVAAAYPFFGLPSSWLIDGQGRIVHQVTGMVTEEQLAQILAMLPAAG